MIVLLAALLLAGQATPNLDQPPNQTMMIEPAAMLLATFDSDNDGRTTHAEMVAGIARSYAAIDTANKGSIGYIQFGDWALRWLGDRNALPGPFEVDGDHDDRITLTELQAQFDKTFTRLDTDHDGALTRAELLTIRAGFGGFDEGGDRKRKRR